MKRAKQSRERISVASDKRMMFALRPAAYCVMLACGELAAAANPTGPAVVSGNVQLQGLGTNQLKITNTPGSIINWQGFSIGAGNVTQRVASICNRKRFPPYPLTDFQTRL